MEFLKDIAGSFGKLSPILTFLLILFLVVFYFLKDTINEVLKALLTRKKKSKIANLKNHDVFITLQQVKKKIDKIEFTTHGEIDKNKTSLLRQLIDIKIKTTNEYLNEFLTRKNVANYSGQELKFEIDSLLRRLVREYNQEAIHAFVKRNILKADAEYLVEAFEEFRADIMEGYIERIESISTNDDYNSNYDRISAILEVFALGLYVIPKDAVNACNKMNGRFLKYKVK